jgi:hypothetical protein
MDTAHWNGKLGTALKDIYSAYVPGLPQDEPYFKIRNINPLNLNRILKTGKNMIFVSTLENQSLQNRSVRKYFTQESLDKIKKDSSRFKVPQRDLFARGQEVLHLFGQTEGQLVFHLEKNKSQLRNYFLAIEKKRLNAKLFKVRENQIEKSIKNKNDFSLKVPYGYDLARSDNDFIWLRQLDPEYEKNVFVHFKTFDSQEPFQDVMAYREGVTNEYMKDVQKPDIFMTLQNGYEEITEVNFKGRYAKQTRGLWKLSDISGGGPFVSYLFVDESQRRMYYLEGYVYAPSKDKREFMQEVEAIVNSFKSGEELKNK